MSSQLLEQLERLVRCQSPTSDLSACQAVIKLAAEIAGEVLTKPAQIRENENRPVFWWGDENPEIVLLTHLDTVWPIDSFAPIWEFKDNRITGPGVFDMKAGFIQALYALRGVSGSVALIATTDEESGSHSSKKLIEDLSRNARAVLVFEASMDGAVKIGRKGSADFKVTVNGRAAHAGLEPEKGINASTELSQLVLQIAKLENPEFGTTVVPTTMSSGSTTNTVPALASVDIDVRSYKAAELNRISAELKALVPQNSEAKITVTGQINRPPLELTSTQSLFERAKEVNAGLGRPPLVGVSVGGVSDGNFAAAVGAPTLDGLGAIGGGAHAQGEWVKADSIDSQITFINALITDLLERP
ncbi:MAG: M20/M25/M40 family metallo-hydrolase [Actinobacteria bacterium]|nr:M20/M25/M40 family metallo-hydrolase [Actinomycetota bacterium]